MEQIWDSLARKRKEQIESGLDVTFREFFVPYYRNLLNPIRPSRLVDIGCGTGHLLFFVRDLARHLVGIDPSSGMINTAKQVLVNSEAELIQCEVQDYSADIPFNLAISHLCLQTVEDAPSFFKAVARILKQGAVFIFTIPHPCFWNEITNFVSDEAYYYLKPSFSYGELTIRGDYVGSVPYFHRPLKDYFLYLNRNGFRLKSFDEVRPDQVTRTPKYIVFQCENLQEKKT